MCPACARWSLAFLDLLWRFPLPASNHADLPPEHCGMSTCSSSSPFLNSKAPLSKLLQETTHVPDLFQSLHGEDARSWLGVCEAEKGSAYVQREKRNSCIVLLHGLEEVDGCVPIQLLPSIPSGQVCNMCLMKRPHSCSWTWTHCCTWLLLLWSLWLR